MNEELTLEQLKFREDGAIRQIKSVNEAFDNYWKGRISRHPKENNNKTKIFARKMFFSGWNNGEWNEMKRQDWLDLKHNIKAMRD